MAIAIILLTENPNLVNQVIRIHHLQTLQRQVRADVTAVLKLGFADLLHYVLFPLLFAAIIEILALKLSYI